MAFRTISEVSESERRLLESMQIGDEIKIKEIDEVFHISSINGEVICLEEGGFITIDEMEWYKNTPSDILFTTQPMSPVGMLKTFTDQQLQEELQRRAQLRKASEPKVFRCRDCKHCAEGCCKRSQRYKTSVCLKKPKPQVGEDRYYATLHSAKACEMFELKEQ